MPREFLAAGAMKHKWRIAFSVAAVVAGGLFAALWVHSYRARDFFYFSVGMRFYHFQSAKGELGFSSSKWPFEAMAWDRRMRSDRDEPLLTLWESNTTPGVDLGWKFRARKIEGADATTYDATVPHWFAIAAMLGLALVPWARREWRFSLHGMLIGVTVVSVVLGLLAWLIR